MCIPLAWNFKQTLPSYNLKGYKITKFQSERHNIRIRMKENKKGSSLESSRSSRVESSQQAGRVQVMVESSLEIVESQVKKGSSDSSLESSRVFLVQARVKSSRVESLQHCLQVPQYYRLSLIEKENLGSILNFSKLKKEHEHINRYQ